MNSGVSRIFTYRPRRPRLGFLTRRVDRLIDILLVDLFRKGGQFGVDFATSLQAPFA